jgi:hypothetical protein
VAYLVGWEEAVAQLGEDLARRLARHTEHRDWSGCPCWDRDRYEALVAEVDTGDPE